MRRNLRLVVLAVIAIDLCGAASAVAGRRASDVPGPAIVASVEGNAIPATLYRMYRHNGIEALGLDSGSPDGRRQIELLENGIVAELIDRTLIEIEARRRGLSIAESDLGAHQERWVVQMGGEERHRTYLREHGLTDQTFLQTIAQELYGERLQTALTSDVTVSDSDVRAFYFRERTNPSRDALFIEPERVTASHILVGARPALIARELAARQALSSDALTAAVRDEMNRRRQLADELRRQAITGADFTELARRWSDDPASRARGGDLGSFTRHMHTVRFDDAAFALTPGAVSPVVETEYGYHVIKLHSRSARRTRTLAEAAPAIRERLLAEKRARHLAEWLKDARQRAAIAIDPFYAPRTDSPSGRQRRGAS
ncbi:MAG: foldase protein PrsA [Gammaproteobacteria bacterium]